MSAAALPAGWDTQVSRSTGETYYVNQHTYESTYDLPTQPASATRAESASTPREEPLPQPEPEPQPEPQPEPEPELAHLCAE